MKVLLPIAALAVVTGCGASVSKSDLIGTWNGMIVVPGESTGIPAMVLTLNADDRYEMSSFAGVMYGDWSLDGKTLTLKMTGLDDGYKKTTDDPGWRSSAKPQSLSVASKDEIVLNVESTPDGKVTFRRASR